MRYFHFLFFAFLLPFSNCQAGEISLIFSGEASINGDIISGKVSFKNVGNQTAYQPQARVQFKDSLLDLSSEEFLLVGDSYQKEFSLKTKNLLKGSYAIEIKFSYTDDAGYRFTLPFLLNVFKEQQSNSQIQITAEDIHYPTNYKSNLTLINTSNVAKDVKLLFFTAMNGEFTAENMGILLGAKEKKVLPLKYTAKNLALNSYPNYALIEYVENSINYTNNTNLNVIVEKKDNYPTRTTEKIIILALVALFIIIFLVKI